MGRQIGEIEAAYASSGRSNCRKCRRAIAKGSLRIGKWEQSKHYDGLTVQWNHAECWAKQAKTTVKSYNDIKGLLHMRPSVQMKLCNLLSLQPPDDIERDFDAAKFDKVVAQLNRNEPLTRAQTNAAAWFIKDELSSLTLKNARAIMTENEQPVTGGQQQIMHRLAEMMLFGALKKCQICKEGDLSFSYSANEYTCHGFSSAWAKCNFKCQGFYSLRRVPFRTPSESKTAFLDDWCNKRHYNDNVWLGRDGERAEADRLIQQLKTQTAGSNAADSSTTTAVSASAVPIEEWSDQQLADKWLSFLTAPVSDLPGVYISATDEEQIKRIWSKAPLSTYKSLATDVVACGSDDYYHALLLKVDLTSGRNAFYRLQVLKVKNRMSFCAWFEWGRVGTSIGQHKFVGDLTRSRAIALFEEKFKDKTGNDWAERENFKKKPGLMSLSDDTSTACGGVADEIEDEDDDAIPSKLPATVQDLLRRLFSRRTAAKMLEQMQFDTRKMPMGKLSPIAVKHAFGILSALEVALSAAVPAVSTLMELSSRFYTIIPHTAPADMSPLPILRTKELVLEKIRMLETLSELIALQSLLETKAALGQSRMDARYAALNCEIKPLAVNGTIHQRVENVMTNTTGPLKLNAKLIRVYKIERKGEKQEYEQATKYMSERPRLLWHGSRFANFVGILSQGLRCAPAAAPKTGYMFGKGVYFADMFGKSAEYCHASRSMPRGLMLLSEVQLGQSYELTHGQYVTPSELALRQASSVKGMGNVEPTGKLDFETSTNASVVKKTTSLPIRFGGKKSKSAYMHFCVVAKEKYAHLPLKEAMAAITSEWKGMSELEKKPYVEMTLGGSWNGAKEAGVVSDDCLQTQAYAATMDTVLRRTTCELEYNEFIVFDPAQTCSQLLIEVEFSNFNAIEGDK